MNRSEDAAVSIHRCHPAASSTLTTPVLTAVVRWSRRWNWSIARCRLGVGEARPTTLTGSIGWQILRGGGWARRLDEPWHWRQAGCPQVQL